jgi:hypothetical protein
MAIGENASLRMSRQAESGAEFSENADQQVWLPSEPLIKIRASERWTPLNHASLFANMNDLVAPPSA